MIMMTSSPVLDRDNVRTKGIMHIPLQLWISFLCNKGVSQDNSIIVNSSVVFILEKNGIFCRSPKLNELGNKGFVKYLSLLGAVQVAVFIKD